MLVVVYVPRTFLRGSPGERMCAFLFRLLLLKDTFLSHSAPACSLFSFRVLARSLLPMETWKVRPTAVPLKGVYPPPPLGFWDILIFLSLGFNRLVTYQGVCTCVCVCACVMLGVLSASCSYVLTSFVSVGNSPRPPHLLLSLHSLPAPLSLCHGGGGAAPCPESESDLECPRYVSVLLLFSLGS